MGDDEQGKSLVLLTPDRKRFHTNTGEWFVVESFEANYIEAMLFTDLDAVDKYCKQYRIQRREVSTVNDLLNQSQLSRQWVPEGVHSTRKAEFLDRLAVLVKDCSEPLEPIILTEWMADILLTSVAVTEKVSGELEPHQVEFVTKAIKLWPKLVEKYPWLGKYDPSN